MGARATDREAGNRSAATNSASARRAIARLAAKNRTINRMFASFGSGFHTTTFGKEKRESSATSSKNTRNQRIKSKISRQAQLHKKSQPKFKADSKKQEFLYAGQHHIYAKTQNQRVEQRRMA